jgi:hypothetical protein
MIGYPYRELHAPGNGICIDGGEDRANDDRDGPVYENQVYDLLYHLAYRSGSRVGNAIVMGIALHACGHASRGVRIHTTRRPIRNALTFFLDHSAFPGVRAGDPLARAGTGAQMRVAYFPFEWPEVGAGRPGEARDEVLLHELVHVYMGQRGLLNPNGLHRRGTPNRVQAFDVVDDFFAVMLTNVYASELRRPPRRDHHGFLPLARSAEEIRNDLAFAPFFRGLAHAVPELVRALERVDTPFNPWRAHPGRMAA